MLHLPDKFRFPYNDDPLFSTIFFTVLAVPLAFFVYLTESFESVKLPLLVFCAGIVLLTLARSKRLMFRWQWPLFFCLAGFFLWSVVSTLFSLDILNSVLGLEGRYTSSILFYGVWALFLFLMWSSLTREKFLFLAKTLIVTTVLVALLGIAQNFGFGYYEGLQPLLRAVTPSFLGNPNFSAMYSVVGLPLIVALWGVVKRFKEKAYYAICGFLVIWAVILFSSRGALLALYGELAVFVVLILLFKLSRTILYYLGAALLIATLLLVPFFLTSRPDTAHNLLNLSEQTANTRVLLWNEARRVIAERPLTGTGPGNFFLGFRQTDNLAVANSEKFDDAHNLFLQIAATAGLPQLLFFLGLLGLAIWYGLAELRRQGSLITAATLAGLAGFIIAGSFNPVVIACWLQLAVLIAGLTYGQGTLREIGRGTALNITLKVSGIILILGAALFLAGKVLSYKGVAAYRNKEYQTAYPHLNVAHKLNPTDTTTTAYLIMTAINLHKPAEKTAPKITSIIALHPNSSGIYETAAILHYTLFRETGVTAYRDEAYGNLDRELELLPNSAFAYYQAAYIDFKMGDFDRALDNVHKSVALKSDQFYSWALLGELYLERGATEQAFLSFKEAQTIRPEEQWIRNLLNQIKSRPGDKNIKSQIFFPEPDI
jgi:O-antigen ligase/predicted negative regulator of RcsB-dependent stress response